MISCSDTFIMLCFRDTVSYVCCAYLLSQTNNHQPIMNLVYSHLCPQYCRTLYKITPRFNPREVTNFNPVKAVWHIISPLRLSRYPHDDCQRWKPVGGFMCFLREALGWSVNHRVQNKSGRRCFDALVHPIIVRRAQMPYLHAQTHKFTPFPYLGTSETQTYALLETDILANNKRLNICSKCILQKQKELKIIVHYKKAHWPYHAKVMASDGNTVVLCFIHVPYFMCPENLVFPKYMVFLLIFFRWNIYVVHKHSEVNIYFDNVNVTLILVTILHLARGL